MYRASISQLMMISDDARFNHALIADFSMDHLSQSLVPSVSTQLESRVLRAVRTAEFARFAIYMELRTFGTKGKRRRYSVRPAF